MKRLLQILTVLALIIIFSMVGIFMFVNPNQFKETLEQQVLARTGRTLSIKGPITWHWSPMLSLKFEDITLENMAPFKGQFFSVKKAFVGLAPESLAIRKPLLNLTFEDVVLNLERNNKGLANWDLETSNSTNSTTQDKKSNSIVLNSIEIKNAKITLQDGIKNNHYTVKDLYLKAEDLAQGFIGISKPFSLGMYVEKWETPYENLSLKGEWAFNQAKNEINFRNIVFEITVPEYKVSTFSGSANIRNLNASPIVEGDFLGKKIKYDKIVLDEIKGHILSQEGIITIAPIHIQIAQSHQLGTVKMDFRGKAPKYSLTQEGRDFEIKHLLNLFDIKDKLEGKTNLKIDLSTSGNNMAEWRQNLSGHSNLEIFEGKFYGADLIKLLKTTQTSIHTLVSTLTKKQKFNLGVEADTITQEWNKPSLGVFTPFNTFKTSTVISNGVVKNSDLSISHADYSVTGQGTVNLANEAIQYQAAVLPKNNPYPQNDEIANYLYTNPLSIKIYGTLSNPIIRPDLNTYMNNALIYTQKNLVEKRVKKEVNKAIEKTVDKAINKNLGNILDKLKKK